jgi:hypothetical protein
MVDNLTESNLCWDQAGQLGAKNQIRTFSMLDLSSLGQIYKSLHSDVMDLLIFSNSVNQIGNITSIAQYIKEIIRSTSYIV